MCLFWKPPVLPKTLKIVETAPMSKFRESACPWRCAHDIMKTNHIAAVSNFAQMFGLPLVCANQNQKSTPPHPLHASRSSRALPFSSPRGGWDKLPPPLHNAIPAYGGAPRGTAKAAGCNLQLAQPGHDPKHATVFPVGRIRQLQRGEEYNRSDWTSISPRQARWLQRHCKANAR